MNYQEIAETFRNGNITVALEAIGAGGVKVCAMLAIQAVEEGLLTRADVLFIASRLVQRQVDRDEEAAR